MGSPEDRRVTNHDHDSRDPRGPDTSEDPLQFVAHHLEKGASRDAYSDFLEYFNFIYDPFDPSLPLKHVKETLVVSGRQAPLFEHVGRIIENYRRILARPSPETENIAPIHGLIRAPKHAGKTILLRVLERSLPKTRHVPRLKPTFVNLRDLIGNSVTQADSRVKWQRWLAELDRKMNQADERLDGMVLFIDDLEYLLSFKSPVKTLESLTWTVKDVFGLDPLVLGTLPTRVFHWLLAKTSQIGGHSHVHEAFLKVIASNNMLRLPLLPIEDIVVLLQKRLEFCSSSVPTWANKEALLTVAQHSGGLPGLALELLKLSLNHVKELGSRRLLTKHVRYVAKLYGFLDLSVSPKDCIDWRDLSERQKQIIFLLLYREAEKYLTTEVSVPLTDEAADLAVEGHTNKQIALQLGINISTLTYHLKPLLHRPEKSGFLLMRRNDDDNRSKVHFLQPRAIPVAEILIDGDLESLQGSSTKRKSSMLDSSLKMTSKKISKA